MNIQDVNYYIEACNREQYRTSDQFAGWVADALSMFNNTDARSIMTHLELGQYAKVGEMIRDRLIAENGYEYEARRKKRMDRSATQRRIQAGHRAASLGQLLLLPWSLCTSSRNFSIEIGTRKSR